MYEVQRKSYRRGHLAILVFASLVWHLLERRRTWLNSYFTVAQDDTIEISSSRARSDESAAVHRENEVKNEINSDKQNVNLIALVTMNLMLPVISVEKHLLKSAFYLQVVCCQLQKYKCQLIFNWENIDHIIEQKNTVQHIISSK